MATIAITVTERPGGNANALLVSWIGVTASDVGAPFEGADWADRCVQVLGNFNAAGATLTMQGSNDGTAGTTWASLTDPQGNAFAKTAAAIEQILETPRFVRPSGSGAGGSIDVYMYCRRSR